MQKIVSYVPLKALGQHLQNDIEHLKKSLKRLNAEDVICICLKLNLLTSNDIGKNMKKRQMQAMQLLENDGLIEKSDHHKILSFCQKSEMEGREAVPINRAGLLELIRWTSIYSKSSLTSQLPNHKHLRQSFIQTLFSCAESYGNREIGPTLPKEATKDEKLDLFILGSRRGAMWSGSHVDPLLELGRTELLLLPFLQSETDYESAFQSVYGLGLDEWMKCNVSLILTQLMPKDPNMLAHSLESAFEFDEELLVGEAVDLRPHISTYLRKISQTLSELKANFAGSTLEKQKAFPFGMLRLKPIIVLNNQRITVIDRKIFLEQMKVGPLFAVSKQLSSDAPIQRYGEACHQYAFKLLDSANQAQRDQNRCTYLINSPEGTKMPLNDMHTRIESGRARA